MEIFEKLYSGILVTGLLLFQIIILTTILLILIIKDRKDNGIY